MKVDTYTPILWVTLTEDERSEEYIRVRTIAAELLAALKGMFNLVNAFDPTKATAAIDAATRAIAKAEGDFKRTGRPTGSPEAEVDGTR